MSDYGFNGEYVYFVSMMEYLEENTNRLTFHKDAEELRQAEKSGPPLGDR